MDTARIAALLQPFLGPAHPQLTQAQLNDISLYIDLLLHWNARINLTAIRDPEEIVTRHFGESLFAATILFPVPELPPGGNSQATSSRQISLADLGSGAGFPGIPIKLWRPELSLTLIESNHKKATFLREVCRELKLPDAKVELSRAETLATRAFDFVTLRAVDRLAEILPAATNLLHTAGRLVLLVSSAQIPGIKSAIPGFHWSEPQTVPISDSRVVLVGSRPPESS
jgi:16S rRNA (guanine527-N7)-methyltransferase